METNQRIEKLLEAQHALTGNADATLYQAPGRVNLLGEHTDYSGGFCMPAALTFNTLVAASPRDDRRLRLNSMDFGEVVEVDLDALSPLRHKEWSAYCAGVAWSMQQAGVKLRGADLTLTGNVPLGAGLSSSASVEVATAVALLGVAGVTLDKVRIALLCQKAENDYVGAPCGIMDQFISANGVCGNALAIDTRALTSELAPIPGHLRLVIANSMVKHSVADGAYGTRRREVEEAARVLHEANPDIVQLRDASLADLDASRAKMSDEAYHRARHVISDSQRVVDGLAALRAGEVLRFGELMSEAHVSFRDDFAASCKECDTLVDEAMKIKGCLGSRLTGGGFGGCTVSLVEAEESEAFADALRAGYERATGVKADVYLSETADGAGLVGL